MARPRKPGATASAEDRSTHVIANTRSTSRPNRVLIALAAAWMVTALAIGGAAHGDARAEAIPAPAVADSTQD